MENIRTLNVCEQYDIKNNIDSVIVSLNAQKAFDSVDHIWTLICRESKHKYPS
jgi:hypothetical protein